eukprot:CAMPEP_0169427102 /NCGR_PEP_ID=MMETSP1042-20121227/585_1 /TAXON_ID=464988 /ORGANISM="Hemiselmis andersenii, Strain CCMP1180" /LENGTH=171 /DNA_ID=CAMNT_0009537125 /DNA_START=110 /DNA_END=623 /DNA_ORIENTATION=+
MPRTQSGTEKARIQVPGTPRTQTPWTHPRLATALETLIAAPQGATEEEEDPREGSLGGFGAGGDAAPDPDHGQEELPQKLGGCNRHQARQQHPPQLRVLITEVDAAPLHRKVDDALKVGPREPAGERSRTLRVVLGPPHFGPKADELSLRDEGDSTAHPDARARKAPSSPP